MIALSCSGDRPTGADASRAPDRPFFVPGDDPTAPAFNSAGQCMDDDVADFGGGPVNCTAVDTKIANVILTQVNGQEYDPQEDPPFVCTEATVTIGVAAVLQTNAQEDRADVGVWIATDGGNARTGSCNHYIIPPGENIENAVNGDNDQCAGIAEKTSVLLPMGTLTLPCVDNNDDGFLDLNGCIAWDVPGQDGVCADNRDGVAPSETSFDFRAATIPGTPAKCNCSTFLVPIVIPKFATIEVVKNCVPTSDGGVFDLEINDVVEKNDATCTAPGNTTGAVQVTAGTNADPGADHTVAESGFTFANYTSTVSCTKNGQPYIASAAYTPDNNLSVHVEPEDAVVCTFVNTRKGNINIVKNTVPDGATDFSFTSNISGNAAFDLDDDGDNANTLSNTKSITNVLPGAYTVTEAAAAGFDLTALTCNDANSTGNTTTRTASINVEAGETVTCTFTNTQQGSITIIKNALPDDPQDFAYTTSGTGLSAFSLDDDGDNANTLSNTRVFNGLSTGAYSVTETLPVTGWALTGLSCVASGAGTSANTTLATGVSSITLGAAGSVTCTYVNTKQAKVQVIKTFSGNPITGSETFQFTLRTGATTTLSGTVLETLTANSTNGGTLNFTTFLTPGATYQICEVVFAGWTSTILNEAGAFTIQTEPDGDNSTICVPFTPTAGQIVVLTIDNRPPPGGEARTIGYWKNWNSCSKSNGNQADKLGEALTAAGGSILIGDLVVDTCAEAVAILNKSTVGANSKKMASDPAYNLAAQLLAAKLNIAAQAGSCDDADDAIADGQALLDAINFNGTGSYKNAPGIAGANAIAAILDDYNNNQLCP